MEFLAGFWCTEKTFRQEKIELAVLVQPLADAINFSLGFCCIAAIQPTAGITMAYSDNVKFFRAIFIVAVNDCPVSGRQRRRVSQLLLGYVFNFSMSSGQTENIEKKQKKNTGINKSIQTLIGFNDVLWREYYFHHSYISLEPMYDSISVHLT